MPMADPTPRAIVYATPGGRIETSCRRLWDLLARRGIATTAQMYPPHCTLTGFFPCPEHLLDDVAARLAGAVPGEWEPPPVLDHLETDEWVGLTVSSPQWEALAVRFADGCAGLPIEAVRPKTNLHLSLAYGPEYVRHQHGHLVQHLFAAVDLGDADWTIGLWTLIGTDWSQVWHT